MNATTNYAKEIAEQLELINKYEAALKVLNGYALKYLENGNVAGYHDCVNVMQVTEANIKFARLLLRAYSN